MTWMTFWTAIGALATVAAVIAGWFYARYTAHLLSLERSPALRVAPAYIGATKDDRRLIIKNVGRGAAIGVMLTDADHHLINFIIDDATLPSIDVVDSPGDGPVDSRPGRMVVEISRVISPSHGERFFIYYQDISGEWHATRFVTVGERFRAYFLGRQKASAIPAAVRQYAHIGKRA